MILATSPIFSLIDDILLVIPLIRLLMIFLPASNNFGPIPVIMLGISPILFDTAVFASSNFSLIVLLASSNLSLTVCTISCPFLIARSEERRVGKECRSREVGSHERRKAL